MKNALTFASAPPDLKTAFAEDGYVVLSGFLSAARVQALQAEAGRLLDSRHVAPDNIRSRFQKNTVAVPERIDPVTDISSTFRAVAADPGLTGAIGQCLGDAPRLFKDKLILKPPRAHGYAMHQDHAWWTGFVPAGRPMVTAMVALDGADGGNGALEVFTRPAKGLIATARDMNAAEERGVEQECAGRLLPVKAGDVVLFHSLTPHRSGPNLTNSFRRALFLTYNQAGAGDLREKYYQYYIARERNDGPQLKFW